jgi:hypothetical protein
MLYTMLRIIITILTISVLLSSCVTVEKKRESKDNPGQILNRAMGEGSAPVGRISALPGAERSDLPYVPVIKPPEIARIWIYDHITPSGDLVVGHWIFIKLKPERWYIEEDYSPAETQRKIPVSPVSTEVK